MMNAFHIGQTVLVSALSAALGATFALKIGPAQDTIRTKELIVEASDGKPAVKIDWMGIWVNGEKPGHRIYITRLSEQQINFVRGDDGLALRLGCLTDGLAGMATYKGWKPRAFLLTSGDRSVLTMVGSEDNREPEEQFPGGIDGSHAVRLTAKSDGADIQIAGTTGTTKKITNASSE